MFLEGLGRPKKEDGPWEEGEAINFSEESSVPGRLQSLGWEASFWLTPHPSWDSASGGCSIRAFLVASSGVGVGQAYII